MLPFLLKKPIAVTMTFIAILILGLVAMRWLPVSLMPDVDIPRISVYLNADGLPAREFENSIVSGMRRQLMQVQHLDDIRSETRDGSAVISMDFEFGSDIDFAFIEVNEKIDRAMSNLPRDTERPRVIKASATDIPVFYLNITLKEREANYEWISPQFLQLSNLSTQVIRKRIEQLPEVAIADISGQVYPEWLILPDMSKLNSLNLTIKDIENAIHKNNVSLGNLIIRDGQYQYNVRFDNTLLTKQEIENIYLKNDLRLLQIKDLCRIIEKPRTIKGKVTSDGRDAITMAIIKQSGARMADLQENLFELVSNFEKDYPDVHFTITRDQTSLLEYSINNLKQSLLIGGLLAFLVMFLFLKDVRSPLLIGITIPASLIISLLFFYLARISINIISLSGLILGIGMMIDNSIIVIDNITQYRERGHSLDEACVLGVNEVFRPMLSSVLTTCAVFVPLIFVSGISGALFYDQAVAISIGLFVSIGVSVTLLPVYYRLTYLRSKGGMEVRWLKRINRLNYENLYESGFRFVMRNQMLIWLTVFLMLGSAVVLYVYLDKEKMPELTRTDTMLNVDWNDRINLEENNRRVSFLAGSLDSLSTHNTALVGQQSFMMEHGSSSTSTQAKLYLQTRSGADLELAKTLIENYLDRNYPKAIYRFEDSGNIFDMVFSEKQAPLVIHLRAMDDYGPVYNRYLQETMNDLSVILTGKIPPLPWQEQLVLRADKASLLLYETDQNEVLQSLKNAFSENQVIRISGNQSFIPVKIGEDPKTLEEIINHTTVHNQNDKPISLASLFTIEKENDLTSIVAGKEGEYYPVPLEIDDKKVLSVMEKIDAHLSEKNLFEAGFSGSYFTNRAMIRNLGMILLISLSLLYFILASQFESLKLPFIVLAEVPIDIFGALLFLKLFGGSINLMSLIGIVVMSGIIINDSILKIDTINRLHNSGMPILKALLVGGQRRLKPILMTSLTTILALLPFLFIEGIGSELQKPLALSVIGGMLVGTAVSLFFIPLGYYYVKKK